MDKEGLGRLLAAVLACALVLPTSVLVAARPAAAADTSGPRILVHFIAGATSAERDRAIRSIGAALDVELPALGVTRIAMPGGDEVDANAAAATIARDPAVVSAEADQPVRLAFVPNDPYYLSDPVSGVGQWGLRRAQVDRAWDLIRGSPSIVVAVIDTGVDATHPDLAGAVLPGATFSTPNANCFPAPSQDDNSHGTHVAGIIGAGGNDAIGIAGVAFGVRILPVKVLDCTGTGSLSDIARGIVWATDNGAKIINISLGSPGDGQTLHDAVRYATSRNVLVVAAAGNCGQSSPVCSGINQPDYPAAYPEVVAVGATTTEDVIASFSTQGSEIAVAAPGVRILSTTPRYTTYQSARGAPTNYAAFSGTSQASPFAVGVAALVWSAEPTLTAQQVAGRLRATADDLGLPGIDPAYGSGRVNAFRAISASRPAASATFDTSAVPRSVATGATFAASVRVTNTSTTTLSASGTSAVRLGYHWLDTSGATIVADGIRTPLPSDIAPGAATAVSATVTAPSTAGAFTLRFDLVRDSGPYFAPDGSPTSDVTITVGSGYGATYAPASIAPTLATGTVAMLSVTLTNTGALTWQARGVNQVRLAYHWIASDGTVALWDGARASEFTSDVNPGQTATVTLAVTPPAKLGSYLLRLDLVQEGLTWFSLQGVATRDVPFSVTSGYGATYTPGTVPTLLPGGRAILPLVIRNDGVATWTAGGATPVRVSSHIVDALGRIVIWEGARTSLAADVAPGGTVTTTLVADMPLVPGSYRLRIDLVREGVSWFSGLGVPAIDVPITVVPDYRATFTSGPLSVSRASPNVLVTIANTSSALWSSQSAAPIRVSAHWYDAAGAVLVWDGPRTTLPRDIAPGESVTVTVALGVPPAGAAAVVIDLVADGLTWFGAGNSRAVTLIP